ncbi:LysR family transcriptional regulator [Paraburkholderia sp. MMS20-SJTN17]|uniref:LysR family transcriptional regulator n=1 Tax=Paraburkholderia translucens TaxID=2886945 RepID=A0ABS8KEW0_9BURK|nr:LysR substrate-binding domain-containing protein [Paraburkholderia sp. MMS20-SJTN17]MCC8403305.1 LysR family transcriptional regulator [Paraburkholderia sp. MMS20-SJTN17]
MKLHQLRALVAVADQGSIIGASRLLFVSQPAITKAIRELESDIGITLLARNASGVTLTPTGASLLRRARLIVGELARAQEEMAWERGALEGTVTVGVTPVSALTLLPGAYRRFRQDMPHVTVRFLEQPPSTLLDSLRQGTLDFALATSSEVVSGSAIQYVDIATFPTAFAVRQNGLLAKATSLEDLCDAEWLFSDTTSMYPAYLAELFEQHGLPAPHRMTLCTSQALLYSLATTIDAVVAWSAHALESVNLREQFRTLDFIQASRNLKLRLIQRESAILTRPSEYFIRCIMDAANAQGPGAGSDAMDDSRCPARAVTSTANACSS